MAGDVTTVQTIPCATLPRTLLDLAAVVSPELLSRACDEAERRGIFDLGAIEDVLERSRGRRGVARLRAMVVDLHSEPAFTRSELERRFLSLCRRRRLPKPGANLWVPLPGGGLEVDFLWNAPRLVAEVDGHQAHGTRLAFEEDRRRDQRLAAAGYRVVRFTWAQVTRRPLEVVETLRPLLAAESAAV
jgi:very-short-patch-repair endonuclease